MIVRPQPSRGRAGKAKVDRLRRARDVSMQARSFAKMSGRNNVVNRPRRVRAVAEAGRCSGRRCTGFKFVGYHRQNKSKEQAPYLYHSAYCRQVKQLHPHDTKQQARLREATDVRQTVASCFTQRHGKQYTTCKPTIYQSSSEKSVDALFP